MGAREEGYKAYKASKNVHDNPYEEEGNFYSTICLSTAGSLGKRMK
jgi:hypothetical protein